VHVRTRPAPRARRYHRQRPVGAGKGLLGQLQSG
jgi:hypothetical protein